MSLRESNDEELGKEYLYNVIYAGHPYGHHNRGTDQRRCRSSRSMTCAPSIATHYTRANLVIGLAGGYPNGFAREGRVRLREHCRPARPTRSASMRRSCRRAPTSTIMTRDTRSTAISLGFPIDVNRASTDWPALAVVVSYLGQHRSSNGYLYQRLREARGLNYGDYAYIEYFPRGMFQFTPDPNLARQQQIFQIWIRPVEPDNGVFALRAALYEYDKLVRDGISRDAFDATREFLAKYANILTQTQNARLGYALDSRYYGIGGLQRLRARRAGEADARGCQPGDSAASDNRPDAHRDRHERPAAIPRRGREEHAVADHLQFAEAEGDHGRGHRHPGVPA